MKKVYFYLIFEYIDYSTEYADSVSICRQSKNFDSIDEAFESKDRCDFQTSPIMEGWI